MANKEVRPHGRVGFQAGMKRPKNMKKTLRRLFSYLTAKPITFVFVAIFILLSTGAGIAGTYLLKPIVNTYIVPFIGGSPTSEQLAPFITMLLVMGLIYLVGALSTYAYNRIMVVIANRSLNTIRRTLFDKIQSLPLAYFDQRTHGEIMSRFSNDVDTLREAVSSGLAQLFVSALTIIGTFTMMLVLSPLLTVLIVVMLFIMFMTVKTIGGRSRKMFQAQQKAVGEVNGYVEELIEGQKVVKVFRHEPVVKQEFHVLNDHLRTVSTQAQTFASMLMPIMMNLSYINYALTAVVGSYFVILTLVDIGTLISFLQFTRSFSMPINQISQLFNMMLAALAGAERIFEVLDEQPEIDEGTVTLVYVCPQPDGTLQECDTFRGNWAWKVPTPEGSFAFVPVKGDVRFEHVHFGYEPGKSVLNDISLYAKPGQKIAFVGSTGAGKTTITNLINRFYDIEQGSITYDGIDIKQIRKDDLRRSLAMVLQDTHLFTGTVKDNIRYGNLDATDEEVVAAAKLANADFFIQHLPQGYDTMLTGDGTNLSQGQRQLLAIARAAIANPPVLILDEATSSIDTRTEALIEKGMDRLMQGRTVFVIAHRLSTVRNANAIMVLEHGEIIERGDHDDLLQQQGKYYQLYTGQFELA